MTGDEKVRKLFGGNYRKLQAIKAEYEQVLSLFFWLLCHIWPTAQILYSGNGSLSSPCLDRFLVAVFTFMFMYTYLCRYYRIRANPWLISWLYTSAGAADTLPSVEPFYRDWSSSPNLCSWWSISEPDDQSLGHLFRWNWYSWQLQVEDVVDAIALPRSDNHWARQESRLSSG